MGNGVLPLINVSDSATHSVLVYVDMPVTDSMRQRAADILSKYPSLTADIMEGGDVHPHTAGQQPETLECPRPQAVAAVRYPHEGSLPILANGLAALPAASSLGHQQHQLNVRILLPEGYAAVVVQLLVHPCQTGLWAGTVQLPRGCAGFKYVQLEAGKWFGDPLVTYSLRWACMALLQSWQTVTYLHTALAPALLALVICARQHSCNCLRPHTGCREVHQAMTSSGVTTPEALRHAARFVNARCLLATPMTASVAAFCFFFTQQGHARGWALARAATGGRGKLCSTTHVPCTAHVLASHT